MYVVEVSYLRCDTSSRHSPVSVSECNWLKVSLLYTFFELCWEDKLSQQAICIQGESRKEKKRKEGLTLERHVCKPNKVHSEFTIVDSKWWVLLKCCLWSGEKKKERKSEALVECFSLQPVAIQVSKKWSKKVIKINSRQWYSESMSEKETRLSEKRREWWKYEDADRLDGCMSKQFICLSSWCAANFFPVNVLLKSDTFCGKETERGKREGKSEESSRNLKCFTFKGSNR